MKFWAIVSNTCREALRRTVTLIILGVGAVMIFVSQFFTLFEFGEAHPIVREMALATTAICGLLIAIFSGSEVIAREIESLTVLTTLSKPVRRETFILGKYFGILLTVTICLSALTIVSLVTVYWKESPVHFFRITGAWIRGEAVTPSQSVKLGGRRFWRELPEGEEKEPPPSVPRQRGQEEKRRVTFGALVRVTASSLAAFSRHQWLQMLIGGLMVLFEAMILVALSVLVSTRLPIVLNMLICWIVFIGGRLSPHLVGYLYPQDAMGRRLVEEVDAMGFTQILFRYPALGIAKFFQTLFPNLANFDVASDIAADLPIPLSLIPWMFGYAALYSAGLLVVAAWLFRRREAA